MSKRRKRWLYAAAGLTIATVVGLAIAASVLSRRFEPFIREQAISYLSERFQCDVEMAKLRIKMPKMSPLNVLLRKGKGASAGVEAEGVALRYRDAPADTPPLFRMRRFNLKVDLGTLFDPVKTVDEVVLEGMEINVPPKGERRALTARNPGEDKGSAAEIHIRKVIVNDAKLTILPKDKTKTPLDFDLQSVTLESEPGQPGMKYQASLTNPKPKGHIESTGKFGPWVAEDPSETPLSGNYEFTNADLSVFKSIAGKLNSTGSFEGVLSHLKAKGEATVPDFRLTMANNPVRLSTRFEVLVDGTNGNTILQPVRATLGSTRFTTSGAVIKHEGDRRRHINLNVNMPDGDLRDVLRLAMKGAPFMEGRLFLKTKIALPPLSGKVREKLRLDGDFKISKAKFLKSTVQSEIDKLSRKGQGAPTSDEIVEVASGMNGSFHMENEKITFRKLAFDVPGAAVDLAGSYDLDTDALDFLGTLKLQARVSQTMTGWKRIALKPVDPFFAKEGAGTFLRIGVVGTSRQPKFGLARSLAKKQEEEEKKATASERSRSSAPRGERESDSSQPRGSKAPPRVAPVSGSALKSR
jgi:hypothetical protein